MIEGLIDPSVQPRAIVFAYHSIGVHSIRVLLARGIHIALVVTHKDNPNETIWFESVASLCAEHHIPTLVDPDSEKLFTTVTGSLFVSSLPTQRKTGLPLALVTFNASCLLSG